jgi:hypothetical protein
MTLEQIVLPLTESRALVEHDIDLDTALIWVMPMKLLGEFRPLPYLKATELKQEVNCHFEFVPAPVLSEILDAIWDKKHYESIVVFRELAMKKRAAWRFYSDERPRFAPTDLLAAAALLMEVSK